MIVCRGRGLVRIVARPVVAAALLALPSAIRAQVVPAAYPARPEAAAVYGPPAPAPAVARTRFVIGLDRATNFQVFSLSNPNRVIVELPDMPLRLPAQPEGGPKGLVKSFRGGLSAPGQSRVVIDVTVPVVVESAKTETGKDGKTHNLVLEIAPVSQGASAKNANRPRPFALGAAGLPPSGAVQPPMPKPAVRPSVKAAKDTKPIIVLDPGHGGHDSGAEKNGTIEKDVVLAFSKTLRDKLEATGLYKVLMTRDSDVFVELGERVAFAERNGAELFIAVHADYADSNSQARGATIYSLRDSVANALKKPAKSDAVASAAPQESSFVPQDGGDVVAAKGFLSSLAEQVVEATRDLTTIFSKSVSETMAASTNMRNDPEQQASFRVLKTAKVPSVLIELAYVTNKDDAENLKSDAWRDNVSDKIVAAVGNCGCLTAIPRKPIETAESAVKE